jgi:transcriptional regulator with XRE-family HTH domain
MLPVTTFSLWLQNEMNQRGWSQSDLARAAETNPGTISNLLNDLRRPGDEICRSIARAFGIPQWEVFMKAGLLTDPPRELNSRYYEIERLADRIQAMPDDERAEMMPIIEQIIAMSEKRRKARDG